MKIHLYSTQGCHLCEHAKALLWPLLLQYQFRLKEIDIADSDEMIERYGARIPVLASPASQRELNWPFTHADIDHFFAELIDL